MSSDKLVDTVEGISDPETRFIPRSGDEEVLWKVVEITAERGSKYKVKWEGIDPATKKPWAQSWVAKHDCTDDLVADWKAKQRGKGKTKGQLIRGRGGKKRGESSLTSRSRSTTTVATTSKRSAGGVSGGALGEARSAEERKKTRSTFRGTASSPLRDMGTPDSRSVEERTRRPSRESPILDDDDVAAVLDLSPSKAKPGSKSQSTSAGIMKRKRKAASPLETVREAGAAMTANGTKGSSEEQEEEEHDTRPRKKLKRLVEVLIPPLSDDDDEDEIKVPLFSKRKQVLLDTSDEEPSKAKPKDKGKGKEKDAGDSRGKLAHRADVRPSKHADVDSRDEGSRRPHSRTKIDIASRREERVPDTEASQEEVLRRPSTLSKDSKSASLERVDDPSGSDREALLLSPKVGPPRSVKRQRGRPMKSRLVDIHEPSRTKPKEDVPAHEPPTEPKGDSFVDDAMSTKKKVLAPPLHKSMPLPPSRAVPHLPILSPGAIARLELFDRMMEDEPEASAAVAGYLPDDDHNPFDTIYLPRPLSPPPSTSKTNAPQLGTPNNLLPESSGKKPQSTPKPSPLKPPSVRAHEPLDLPTIAVITPSVNSSNSPPDCHVLHQKAPLSPGWPPKRSALKRVPQISPATFRSALESHAPGVNGVDGPPSSIESFDSPKRVDKGKRKATETDDVPQSSLSEGEGSGDTKKRRAQGTVVTDSMLKKRGKELFDQVHLAREVERQKVKKKSLKSLLEAVNGMRHSSSRSPLLPVVEGVAVEMQWEDVVDLTMEPNSATLDTTEHGQTQSLTPAERERLRIELRQEEEENTQEAMDAFPIEVINQPEVAGGEKNVPKSPLISSRSSPPRAQAGNLNHAEPPSSAEIQLASVIVQPSQERHDEMDTDPDPSRINQPESSPARPVLENLTDSPKRKLSEALSLLNVKSEEIQRLERELADVHRSLGNLKVEFAQVQRSEHGVWEAERAQWTLERSTWETDRSAREAERAKMLEEKMRLLERVAELSDAAVRAEKANVKVLKLEAERVTWTGERETWARERERMLHDLARRSEELAAAVKTSAEDDQERAKKDIQEAEWAEERTKWETERVAMQEKQEVMSRSVDELAASVHSLTSAKTSAEKDRDFFREQYMQASGFVGSVRAENVELENRVKIAEGQAQEGVAAIKVLFEGRVKALQADIDRWKSLSEILQEKDKRTNDEVRLRAAQVPELTDLCRHLVVENKSLDVDLRKISQAQQRTIAQRAGLYSQILMLKKERASLQSKLLKVAKTVEGSGDDSRQTSQPQLHLHLQPQPQPQHQPCVQPDLKLVSRTTTLPPPSCVDLEGIDPNDMDVLPPASSSMVVSPPPPPPDASSDEPKLFPCMWRPQGKEQCQQVFDTKEDLERHVQEHYQDLLNDE